MRLSRRLLDRLWQPLLRFSRTRRSHCHPCLAAPFTTPLSAPVAASLAACQLQPKENDSREQCWWHACSDLAELTVASLQLDALRRTDASHWRSSLEILLPTACVVYASRCRRRVQVSRLELSFRGSGGLPLGVVPFSPVGSAWFGVRCAP